MARSPFGECDTGGEGKSSLTPGYITYGASVSALLPLDKVYQEEFLFNSQGPLTTVQWDHVNADLPAQVICKHLKSLGVEH